MTRPHKNSKTGVYYFRQKVPVDLRIVVGKAEVIRSLKTKDPEEAKARFAQAALKQGRVWQSLRSTPSVLPHKQIMALAGDYRRELDATLEDEPGEPAIWEAVLRLEAEKSSSADALEGWAGSTADTLLQEAGLAADTPSRFRLLTEMHRVRVEWAAFQDRRAGGDYRPDPRAERFPEWKPSSAPEVAPKGRQAKGETLTSLFALWETQHLKTGKPQRTAEDFKHKLNSLRKYLGHDDASRVTGRAVGDWCDGLLGSGLSEKTVGEKYLASVKAVFKLAVEKFRLPVSPVAANKVRVPDRVKARPSGFTDDEAKAILRAALVNPDDLGNRPDAAKRAIRWVPWICAYTGARVGEISQLGKEDLITVSDTPCIRITPEGGTVKTGKYRIVPIHPHLVEQGLIAFITPAAPILLHFA